MNDQWVLLWSQSQCAFHIEPLDAMLKTNAGAFRADRRMDYVPLHIGTPSQCHTMADALRSTLHARQDVRRAAEMAIGKARA